MSIIGEIKEFDKLSSSTKIILLVVFFTFFVPGFLLFRIFDNEVFNSLDLVRLTILIISYCLPLLLINFVFSAFIGVSFTKTDDDNELIGLTFLITPIAHFMIMYISFFIVWLSETLNWKSFYITYIIVWVVVCVIRVVYYRIRYGNKK